MPRTHEQLQAYVSLLLEASKRLRAAGLLLSVALHPRQFMPPQVYDAVDIIHIMTYDMADNHVAPYNMVVRAVEEFIKYGCPASKMLLGIPAYARHYQNPGLVKTFAEIMDDSSGMAVSTQEWNGYRYDSQASIHRKVGYAIEKGTAGVFFWELGQDKQHPKLGPGGILLEAAARFAKQVLLDQDTAEL